jgi:hypothetical protein
MMRTTALIAAVLILSSGCGSAAQSGKEASGGDRTSSPSPSPRGCVGRENNFTTMENLVKLDVNGDGTAEQVGIATPQGCPPMLAVDGLGQVVATPLPEGQPPVRSAYGVDVPGRQGSLVVTRQDHPRGGYQLRVFALDNNSLAELTTNGETLFPFVATDVEEHPASIDCADDGIVVTEAVPHEPVGIAPAWDVKQTTYTLRDGKVTAGPTQEVADNVLPKQLAGKYPDLVKHSAFASCRA